jgi:hypothetical protein
LRAFIVLTPQEKAAAICVLGALLLGIATQQYRAHHPPPPRTPTLYGAKKKTPAQFDRDRVAATPAAQDADDDDD